MIYFLKIIENNTIKIGYSKYNDLQRVSSYEHLHPFKSEFLLFLEGDLKFEKELHEKFKHLKVEGKKEWFMLSDEILGFIDENIGNAIELIGFSEERKKARIKSNPIGVRFNTELLEALKKAGLADSPQKALNLYERSYLELVNLRVETNNQPENKEKIQKERSGIVSKTSETPQISTQAQIKVDVPKKEEVPKNELKQGNLTDKPVRLPNEDALDYAGRVNEWKKLQK